MESRPQNKVSSKNNNDRIYFNINESPVKIGSMSVLITPSTYSKTVKVIVTKFNKSLQCLKHLRLTALAIDRCGEPPGAVEFRG